GLFLLATGDNELTLERRARVLGTPTSAPPPLARPLSLWERDRVRADRWAGSGGRPIPVHTALAMGDRGVRGIGGVSRTRPHGAPPCPPPACPPRTPDTSPWRRGSGAAGPWNRCGSPRGRVGTEHPPIGGPPAGHRAPADWAGPRTARCR